MIYRRTLKQDRARAREELRINPTITTYYMIDDYEVRAAVTYRQLAESSAKVSASFNLLGESIKRFDDELAKWGDLP